MSKSVAQVAAWEDFVLRSIGIFKIFKAICCLVLALGVREILHQHHDYSFEDALRVYIVDPMHFDSENRLIAWALDKAHSVTPHTIRFFSYVGFVYAAIFATEGVGLYLRQHWAEYMVLVATGSLLPVEFYEIYLKLAWWKFGVTAINVAILSYLVHRLLLDSRLDCPRARRKARVAEAKAKKLGELKRESEPSVAAK